MGNVCTGGRFCRTTASGKWLAARCRITGGCSGYGAVHACATADWISRTVPELRSRASRLIRPPGCPASLVGCDHWLWQRVSAADNCERMAMTCCRVITAVWAGVQRDKRLASLQGLDSQRWFWSCRHRQCRTQHRQLAREPALSAAHFTGSWHHVTAPGEAAAVWTSLLKNLPWRSLLLAVVINAFLIGLYYLGHKSGHENATRDGDKAVGELQSAFDTYKSEQAAAARTLRCGHGPPAIRLRGRRRATG